MRRLTLAILLLAAMEAAAQGKFFGGESPASYTGTLVSMSVLPVELLSFSALSADRAVRLMWATATEINNDYFQVEALIDGAFQSIGVVGGSGTTASPKHYSFLDTSPVQGINFYRLRQVDYDGTATLSSVVSASFLLGTSQLYPNPTVGPLFINADLTNENVSIHDLSGRLLKRLEVHREMDISQLHPGMYLLRIRFKDEELLFKVNKE
ncbi:MAG: T9SS type A sorting domain-containing protein [Bacteroidota bacterium]